MTNLLKIGVFCLILPFFGNAANPTFPSVNELFGELYHTKVSNIILPSGKTSYVEETYQMKTFRGRLDNTKEGDSYSKFYGKMKEAMLEKTGYVCKAEDPNENPEFNKTKGWVYRDDSQERLIYGPSALLWWAAENPVAAYEDTKPRDEFGGMNAVQFTKPDPENSDYNYFFFFTDPNESWSTPSGQGSYPLLITHWRKDLSISEDKPRRDMYFRYFRKNEENTFITYLQIPTTLGCEGYSTPDNVMKPMNPGIYSILTEKLQLNSDKLETDVQFSEVYFDNLNGIVTYSAMSRGDERNKLVDRNDNIEYTFNHDRTECTINPMDEGYLFNVGIVDPVQPAADSDEQLPIEMYYIGMGFARGILCDIHEFVDFDVPLNGRYFVKLVYTYYIMSSAEQEAEEGKVEMKDPVRVIVTGYEKIDGKPSYQMQFEYFEFARVKSMGRRNNFDIGLCFPDDKKTGFAITFPSDPDKISTLMNFADEIGQQAQKMLTGKLSVSNSRISTVASFDAATVTIHGVLYDRAPSMSRFIGIPDMTQPMTSDINRNVVDNTEECARMCMDLLECKEFLFCGQACFLRVKTPAGSYPLYGYQGCQMFEKVVNQTDNQATMGQAISDLQDKVAEGLQFEIGILTGGIATISANLSASDVDVGLDPVSWTTKGDLYDEVFPEMILKAPENKPGVFRVKSGIRSHQECFRKCQENNCSSFSYCQKSRDCRLTSTVLLTDDELSREFIEPNTMCSVMTVSYLKYYTSYPGMALLEPGNKFVQGVRGAPECAKSCRNNTDFTCRGFQYCNQGGAQICVLRDKDFPSDLDSDLAEIADTAYSCTYYTADYQQDFMKMKGTKLDSAPISPAVGTSRVDCSKMCSENSNCKSFNYCGFQCEMLDTTLLADNAKSISLKECDHYAKRDEFNSWISRKVDIDDKTTGGGGDTVSTASLGGGIAGGLIVGLILGVAIFFAYSYYKSKKGDDTSILYRAGP